MLKKLDESKYSIPTRLIYGKSVTEEWDYSHHVTPPISASSTFRLDSAGRGATGFEAIGNRELVERLGGPTYVYARMAEPNNDMLSHALAVAERAEVAVTFASGMAAVHAAVCVRLQAGDEIISHKTIYGCTYSMFTTRLPRFGVKTHFVDLKDPLAWVPLVTDRTRILYLEAPANPSLALIEVDTVCKKLKEINKTRPADRQILTVMDNTFATPWCQRPIEHGVDIVVHSLTKGISGFGTDIGGAVVTRQEFHDELILFRKDYGGILSPQTAWHILVYGISTLSLRLPRQIENALAIARFLETHPKVAKVAYPGLESFPQYDVAKRLMRDYEGNFAPGIIVFFSLKGKDPADALRSGQKMMDFIAQSSYTITLAVSLGQLRTLIEHPGSMTHRAYKPEEQLAFGFDPGGIRLAVGIEPVGDIIADLGRALDAI
ncbi:MAG: PLP-dependent aspartate aminotransferase family protein [Bdellovibrionota bacterium]|nr:MAG: PLP-dependent aspartate aminotransferase family protein [Bdellovibrionota bacterium]